MTPPLRFEYDSPVVNLSKPYPVRCIAAETGQILNLGQTASVHQKQAQSIKLGPNIEIQKSSKCQEP